MQKFINWLQWDYEIPNWVCALVITDFVFSVINYFI